LTHNVRKGKKLGDEGGGGGGGDDNALAGLYMKDLWFFLKQPTFFCWT